VRALEEDVFLADLNAVVTPGHSGDLSCKWMRFRPAWLKQRKQKSSDSKGFSGSSWGL